MKIAFYIIAGSILLLAFGMARRERRKEQKPLSWREEAQIDAYEDTWMNN